MVNFLSNEIFINKNFSKYEEEFKNKYMQNYKKIDSKYTNFGDYIRDIVYLFDNNNAQIIKLATGQKEYLYKIFTEEEKVIYRFLFNLDSLEDIEKYYNTHKFSSGNNKLVVLEILINKLIEMNYKNTVSMLSIYDLKNQYVNMYDDYKNSEELSIYVYMKYIRIKMDLIFENIIISDTINIYDLHSLLDEVLLKSSNNKYIKKAFVENCINELFLLMEGNDYNYELLEYTNSIARDYKDLYTMITVLKIMKRIINHRWFSGLFDSLINQFCDCMDNFSSTLNSLTYFDKNNIPKFLSVYIFILEMYRQGYYNKYSSIPFSVFDSYSDCKELNRFNSLWNYIQSDCAYIYNFFSDKEWKNYLDME